MMFLSDFPLWYQLFFVGMLGSILASFVNVIVYRMHTNASINGRSRCFSCGHSLSWYELIPLVSYFIQKGRCRSCRAKIVWRDVIVEVVMVVIFIWLYLQSLSLVYFFLASLLALVLLAVILYDIAHMIIPNEFVIAALAIVAGINAWRWHTGLFFDEWWYLVISAISGFSVYAGLWLVSKGRWIGLGDAKLAIPLSILLTPSEVFSMVVLSFWVGAGVSCVLLLSQGITRFFRNRHYARLGIVNTGRYLTMKSEIPFAPFLVIAFVLVYLLGVDVLSFVTYAFV